MSTTNIFEKLENIIYDIDLNGIIPNEDKPFIFKKYIKDIKFLSYYDNCVFPIIEVNLNLPRYYYVKMQEHANEILFLLNIKRYRVSNMTDKTEGLLYDMYIVDELLKPYDIPRTSIAPLSKTSKITNGQPSDESNNEVFPMKISCFFKKHLDYNKQPNMGIFTDVKLNDIFMYLLNNNSVSNNVLMQNCDNDNYVEQVILPSLSMTNTFKYLQEVYGCYKYGIRIFFDLKYNYILGKNKMKNVPTPKGIRYDKYNQIFIEFLSVDQPNTGSMVDTKNNMLKLVLPDTNSVFVVNDATNREIGGEVVKFMSRTNDNNSIGRSYKIMYGIDDDKVTTNSELPKELVKWNNYSNIYAESEYKSDLTRSQLKVVVTWTDLDLDLLLPHKNYEINYDIPEYMKYNGSYKLVSNTFVFSANGQESRFKVIGSSIFEKVNKDFQD